MDELFKLYIQCFYEGQPINDKIKLGAKTAIKQLTDGENIAPSVLKEIFARVYTLPLDKRYKDFLARKNKFIALNLIDYKEEYFHPYLFTVSKPKKYFNDEDILVTEDYTMKKETKDRFSINHIINYLKLSFPNTYIDQTKDSKVVQHLLRIAIPERLTKIKPNISVAELNRDALDILMFTIDACAITFNDEGKKLVNIISLSDFIETGMEMRDSKINCLKEQKIDEEKEYAMD